MTAYTIENYINTVIQGDCLEIMKQLPEHSVDMILCDLPYGVTQNKWDSIIPLEDYIVVDQKPFNREEYLLHTYQKNIPITDALAYWEGHCQEGLWTLYKRVIKPNGAIVLTSNELFTSELIKSNPSWFKYRWVWTKSKATNFLNAKKQPLRKFEDICVFYGKQPTYNPQMTMGEAYDKGIRKDQLTGSYGDFKPRHVISEGNRYPVDVVYFKTAESEGEVWHPTQKPVELGRYMVRTYTNPGDIVLDNTCGSGSFLVSALLEGRNFIGIEKNENAELFKKQQIDYIKLSEKRIADAWKYLPIELKESIRRINLLEDRM